MTEWPILVDRGVPSPEVVAAWSQLDMVPTERVPLWAAYWLAAGYDGEHLAHLAGLHGDDPHGWGRADEELAGVVREASEEQLRNDSAAT